MDDITLVNFRQILEKYIINIGFTKINHNLLEELSVELKDEFLQIIKDKMTSYSLKVIEKSFNAENILIEKNDFMQKEIKTSQIEKQLSFKGNSDFSVRPNNDDAFSEKDSKSSNPLENRVQRGYNYREFVPIKESKTTNNNYISPQLKSILDELVKLNIYTTEYLENNFPKEIALVEIETKKALIKLYPGIFQSNNKSLIDKINEYLVKTNTQIKIEITELNKGTNIKYFPLASKIVYSGENSILGKLDDSEKKYLQDSMFKVNSDQEGEILLQFYPEIKVNGEIILNGKALVSAGK